MSLLWFLLIGLAAGWLAGQIMKGREYGLWVNLLLGVAGSFLGGFLFGGGGSLIMSLVTALAGAIILLVIIGLVKKK